MLNTHTGFFFFAVGGVRQADLKDHVEKQTSRKSQENSGSRGWRKGRIKSDNQPCHIIKTCRAVVIKTVHVTSTSTDRSITQNRTESSKLDSNRYRNLIYNKSNISNWWGKDGLLSCWDSCGAF